MQQLQEPQEEPAHDVLAADEFAVPTPDPSLRREHVVLPEDPSGIAEPHDVLAAEEFAMPATPPAGMGFGSTLARHARTSPTRGAGLAAMGLGALLMLRRRRGS